MQTVNLNGTQDASVPFSVASNMHYRINEVDELTGDGYKLLSQMIQHFLLNQVPRLQTLDDYSKARNTAIYMGDRRKDNTKADYRIVHNFGKLIAQFVSGYTTSVPLKYAVTDKQQQKTIEQFNTDNDVPTVDNALMYDVAKFGRAYDIQYRNDAGDQLKKANPFETFVIYDTSIDRLPIAAVRIVAGEFAGDSQQQTYTITLYTDSEIITFAPLKMGETQLIEVGRQPHFYNAVPIVEYQSNDYRTGWYEDVISLIDAYDQSASDTSNYMTDLVNSLLVISGDFKAPDKGVDELIRQIKQYGVLGLQSGYNPNNGGQTAIDAKYISPEFDSAASEDYKSRIRRDIFNISNIPDMTDKNFSGNQTGVAMRYKVFGFEQAIAQTTNAFKRSLARRYQVLFNMLKNTSNHADFEPVNVTFTPNLPYAVSEEVQMLIAAGVPLSRKTMYNQVHFTNADTEEANLKQEEADKPTATATFATDADQDRANGDQV